MFHRTGVLFEREREAKARYVDFCKETGLKEQPERFRVANAGDGLNVNYQKVEKAKWTEMTLSDSVGSGIINAKDYENIPITQEAIDAVPLVTPEGWTQEKAERLREAHREVLRRAKAEPLGTEVGATFLEGIIAPEYTVGKIGSVNIPDRDKQYIAVHNHPSGQIFSKQDIENFVLNAKRRTMSVVGNDGCIYVLSKKENINSSGFIRLFMQYNSELDDAVQKRDPESYISTMKKILYEGDGYGYDFIERR